MQFEITLYQLTAHEKVQVFELGAGDEKIPSACQGQRGSKYSLNFKDPISKKCSL